MLTCSCRAAADCCCCWKGIGAKKAEARPSKARRRTASTFIVRKPVID